jgi:hypothetical protein
VNSKSFSRSATTLRLTLCGRAPFLLSPRADWSTAVVLAARWAIFSEPTVNTPSKDCGTVSSIRVARGTLGLHHCM